MGNWKRRRLINYDYSQEGLYFITICCQKKENFFWKKDVYDNEVGELTFAGKTVRNELENLSLKYPDIMIHNYVIMPNHIHCLIEIKNQSVDLSVIINQTKGKISKILGYSPWQRSYHDHIIRGDDDYEAIWNYIEANPSKWNEDKYYIM